MLDYDSLKAMAKAIGRPVTDLLALSPSADPFYIGDGARRQAAEWFAAVWAEHGAAGSHLRRLHYQLGLGRHADPQAGRQRVPEHGRRLEAPRRRQPVGALPGL